MIKKLEDITCILNRSTLQQIIKCVDLATPNESCGLIFGEIQEIVKHNEYYYEYIGKKVRCIPSDKKSMISFLIENIENLHELILEVLQSERGLQLLSIFHSHPAGNNPSSVDEANMRYLDKFGEGTTKFITKAFKNLIWVIIDSTNYDLNGFIFFDHKIQKVGVIIR